MGIFARKRYLFHMSYTPTKALAAMLELIINSVHFPSNMFQKDDLNL